MHFCVNDFRIVHGCTLEEIESQVKVLQEQGYTMHGSVVAQPNPHYTSDTLDNQLPYLYYQMLARHKTKPAAADSVSEEELQ